MTDTLEKWIDAVLSELVSSCPDKEMDRRVEATERAAIKALSDPSVSFGCKMRVLRYSMFGHENQIQPTIEAFDAIVAAVSSS